MTAREEQHPRVENTLQTCSTATRITPQLPLEQDGPGATPASTSAGTAPQPSNQEGARPVSAPALPPHTRHAHAQEKLTAAEVCAELKISRSTFYYWRQIGKAPRCMVLPNREVRVYRCDLDDWLAARTEGV